jgi:hypothetical protein
LIALDWETHSKLALDAESSIVFRSPITVAGAGAVSLLYNDGGSGGDLFFFDQGKLYFQNLGSKLTINNTPYTLVGDLPSLATAIAGNPTGAFALTQGYDASADVYSGCPVEQFQGMFEGLGHHIQNVKVGWPVSSAGLFCTLRGATVRDLALINIKSHGHHQAGAVAGYVESNSSIIGVSVEGGRIKSQDAGGLAGFFDNSKILRSRTNVSVKGARIAGGLIGWFGLGSVDQSYARGTVFAWAGAGGLVGADPSNVGGQVTNCYAIGSVAGPNAGGIFGYKHAGLWNSYSLSMIDSHYDGTGGLIGYNDRGAVQNDYWDLDTSGQSDACGGGTGCAGAIGLTDTQMKSGLPNGFDPKIWGQSPNINNGYPYLLANPPQ